MHCRALFVALLAFGAMACQQGRGLDTPHALIIDGVFVEPLQPIAGQSAVISALVRDSDDHDVEVSWDVPDGDATATGFGVVWVTPQAPAAYRIDFFVRDLAAPDRASAVLFVPVVPPTIVMEPGDQPPTILSFTTDAESLTTSATANLCVVADDPDGDALTYHWTFPPGDWVDNGTCAAYTAFAGACLPGTYPFVVRVEDGRGGFAEDVLFIWIDPFTSGE